jgi:hypothetical protein
MFVFPYDDSIDNLNCIKIISKGSGNITVDLINLKTNLSVMTESNDLKEDINITLYNNFPKLDDFNTAFQVVFKVPPSSNIELLSIEVTL